MSANGLVLPRHKEEVMADSYLKKLMKETDSYFKPRRCYLRGNERNETADARPYSI
jgi:hypothetical protein